MSFNMTGEELYDEDCQKHLTICANLFRGRGPLACLTIPSLVRLVLVFCNEGDAKQILVLLISCAIILRCFIFFGLSLALFSLVLSF